MIRDDSLRPASKSVAILCLVVLSLLAIGYISEPIAAQNEDGITIERDGDKLIITVNESIAGEFDEGNISISNSSGFDVEEFSIEPTDGGEVERIDLFDLPSGNNLENAEIHVRLTQVEESEVINQKITDIDLRAIEFGNEEAVEIDDRTLVLPVSNVTGVENETQVAVRNPQERTRSTLQKTNGNWTVNTVDIYENMNMFADISIEAFPDSEKANKSFLRERGLSVVNKVDAEITTDDENRLLLESDLIFEGQTYNIAINSDKIDNQSASKFGALRLDPENVLDSGQANLTVTDEKWNATVFEEPIPFDKQEIFDAARAVTSPTVEGTTIRHPLLFDDEQYILKVTTHEPNGIFYERDTPSDNQITFDENLFGAREITVSATNADGWLVFETTPDPGQLIEPTSTTATLDSNTLNLTNAAEGPDSIDFSTVENVWIRHNNNVTILGGESIHAENNTIDTSDVEPTLTTTDDIDVILIQRDSSDITRFSVAFEEAPNQPDGESSFGIGDNSNLTAVVGIGIVISGLIVVGVPYATRFTTAQNIPTYSIRMIALFIMHLLILALVLTRFYNGNQSDVLLGGWLLGVVIPMLLPVVISGGKGMMDVIYSFAIGSVMFIIVVTFHLLGFLPIELVIGEPLGAFLPITILLADTLTKKTVDDTATKSTGVQPVQVTVEVIDRVRGGLVNSKIDINIRKEGRRSNSMTINGGRSSIQLQPGTWTFTATVSGVQMSEQKHVSRGNQSVQLTFPGVELTVDVQSNNGQGIPGAAVEIDAPEFTDRGSTTRNGTYTTNLPVDASSATVTAEHELFQSDSRSVRLTGNGTNAVLNLVPKEGHISVTAMLNRDPVSDVEITVTRRTEPKQSFSGKTNARGRVELSGILIGDYTIDADLPVSSSAFTVSAETVTVREGQTAQGRVTIRFDYSLSRGHKSRISDLRGQLTDIARLSRRDNAIQRYYASALQAVLDEVEHIPRSGHPFIEHNQDPDAVVEAVLDATEQATKMLDDVLSSKRNVDLFSACSDLPDASVKWRGSADISELLSLTTMGVGQQRAEINAKLESVDERITSERRDLAEVSPAREMWDSVREMVRDQPGNSEHALVATIFVAMVLLDTIEALFEQQELRKRLEKTVY